MSALAMRAQQVAVWLAERWRSAIVLGVFAVAALVMVGRAIDLQVNERGFYTQQGGDRQQRVRTIPAHRGVITDRNGEPLAISVPVEAIWIDPSELQDKPEAVDKLADLLRMPVTDLQTLVHKNRKRRFLYVKRQMQPSRAARVRAAHLPGVGLRQEYKRFYPTGDVSAALIGFTNIDDQGQAGLEATYNSVLAGKPGKRRILKDAHGHEIDDLGVIRQAEPGHDLTLSIDRRLQYLTYRELATGVEQHHAQSGSAVLMNVATGEILAMASVPSFNPNNRASFKPRLMRNRAVIDQFEPGSSMKPFTILSALESGHWTPKSTVDTAPGYIRVGGYTIRDHRDYGTLDLRGILEKSSNVGASHIALDLGNQQLWDTFHAFGFGQSVGIGFPGEVAGRMEFWRKWSTSGTAAHAYGYGLSVTTLQLAAAYAALANHGRYIQPTLIQREHVPAGKQIAPAHYANEVVSMLRAVVSPEGTAPKARIAGFHVAGKTGTARRMSADGSYSRKNYNTVFAGIAPATDPRLVLVVVVNNPQKGSFYAGDVSAPIFERIMSGALRMLNIRPDNLPNEPAEQKPAMTAALAHPNSEGMPRRTGKQQGGGRS